jgi:hypothetical protein
MGILSQSFKRTHRKSRLAARKRDFGRKEISECGKLRKTSSRPEIGHVRRPLPTDFFGFFGALKKGGLFWRPQKKVRINKNFSPIAKKHGDSSS